MPKAGSGHHAVSINEEAKQALEEVQRLIEAETGFRPNMSQTILWLHHKMI